MRYHAINLYDMIHRTGPQAKPVELTGGLGNIWLWALLETLAFGMALPASVGVLMLLFWHLNLVLSNRSTIEYQEVRHEGGYMLILSPTMVVVWTAVWMMQLQTAV